MTVWQLLNQFSRPGGVYNTWPQNYTVPTNKQKDIIQQINVSIVIQKKTDWLTMWIITYIILCTWILANTLGISIFWPILLILQD